MIDLHTHSTASDGILTPSELIEHAFNNKVEVLALTDHDTIDGLEEAATAAEKFGITFVPGVELNIAWPTGEFHLLGLGLKKVSKSLLDILKNLQESRDERNRHIIQKMKDAGYDVSLDEIQSEFKTKCLGRPHFAA